MKQFLHILSSLLAAVRQVFLSVLDYFKRLKESRSRYYTRRRDKKRAASGKVHTQNKTTVIKEQPLDIVYPDDLNPDIDKLPAENIVRQFPVSGSPENSTDRRKQFHPKKSARQRITELRHLAGRISRPAFKNIRPAYIIAAIAGVFVLTGLITYASLRSKNEYTLDVSLNGDPVIVLEYGTPFEDPGASASYQGSIIHKNDQPDLPVTTKMDQEPVEPGTYLVTYSAEYEELKDGAMRVVHVVDTVPPEITLTTNPDAYTLPGHPYEEEGFTASDNHDGDLTAQVTSEEKDGHVYYTVSDASGNTATADRAIVYDDRTAPVLTLKDDVPLEIVVGDEWKDSFTATDDLDGDITSKVKVEGKVDNYKEGTYTLKYTSEDAHGNASTAERTVTVKPLPKNDPSLAVNGEKIVFLTFDDGPGEYTAELLDILAKYNVKATFFVTGTGKYLDLIGREAAEGHTVGVHTLTHDYDKIYADEDAFLEDFDAMNDIIEQQTGSRTNIMRFPGGSSNTVSAGNEGLMTRLTVQAQKKGYDYYDWNAYDGDVYETTDPEQISQNIIDGIQQQSISVVLCHDTKEYTKDGIEDAIRWALENGYTFLPITFGCFECHHEVQN
ncbi:MAG: polysaccharide deacetylase family protein [Eubacterium sp.]|nr:polysaccharide deacetylase family protein [Eubacterium sp.]